jgi:hypothetical protein
MAQATPDRRETADVLDSLLRGEISAAETYTQAITKFDRKPEAARLDELRKDHVEAANLLRRHVKARGEVNSTSSGPWGTFAKAVEGTAAAMGMNPAIKALKEGEQHGVKEYESALGKDDLDAGARDLISKTLLPRQRAHVGVLDGILNGPTRT